MNIMEMEQQPATENESLENAKKPKKEKKVKKIKKATLGRAVKDGKVMIADDPMLSEQEIDDAQDASARSLSKKKKKTRKKSSSSKAKSSLKETNNKNGLEKSSTGLATLKSNTKTARRIPRDKLRNMEPLLEPTAHVSGEIEPSYISEDDVTASSAEEVDKDHESVPSMLQQPYDADTDADRGRSNKQRMHKKRLLKKKKTLSETAGDSKPNPAKSLADNTTERTEEDDSYSYSSASFDLVLPTKDLGCIHGGSGLTDDSSLTSSSVNGPNLHLASTEELRAELDKRLGRLASSSGTGTEEKQHWGDQLLGEDTVTSRTPSNDSLPSLQEKAQEAATDVEETKTKESITIPRLSSSSFFAAVNSAQNSNREEQQSLEPLGKSVNVPASPTAPGGTVRDAGSSINRNVPPEETDSSKLTLDNDQSSIGEKSQDNSVTRRKRFWYPFGRNTGKQDSDVASRDSCSKDAVEESEAAAKKRKAQEHKARVLKAAPAASYSLMDEEYNDRRTTRLLSLRAERDRRKQEEEQLKQERKKKWEKKRQEEREAAQQEQKSNEESKEEIQSPAPDLLGAVDTKEETNDETLLFNTIECTEDKQQHNKLESKRVGESRLSKEDLTKLSTKQSKKKKSKGTRAV